MDKQETLEEAAEDYVKLNKLFANTRNAFIKGAKWQAEKMYSEEDIKAAFDAGQSNIDCHEMHGLFAELTTEEWFEQFKKSRIIK